MLSDGEVDQQKLNSNKLRPCYIHHESQMPSKALRAKAVQAACDAVRKHDSYSQRAIYIRDKYEAEEDGDWACLINQVDAKAVVQYSFFSKNRLAFRVGDCEFELWKATSTA